MSDVMEKDKFHRTMQVEARSDEQRDKRIVELSMSSESPVERIFGNEILVHDSKAIRMGFIASGNAPVLLGHDHDRQIGVIQKAWLDESEKKIRVRVRFSKSALASEILDDIDDGIRKNVSVGYYIHQIEKTKREGDANVLARVVDWEPFEVSFVSVPADVNVGVGRHQPQKDKPMSEPEAKTIDVEAVKREAAREVETRYKDHVSSEDATRMAAQRADEVALIFEIAQRHNKADLATKAVKEGKSLAEFQRAMLDTLPEGTPLVRNEIGMTPKEVKRFSILRLARAVEPGASKAQRDAAMFEYEACSAAADMLPAGVETKGFRMPEDVMYNWRSPHRMARKLNVTDEADLVPEEHMASMFVDVLRNSSSVMQAGARMMQGLSGNVDIPAKLAASVAAWVNTETTDVSASEMTTRTIELSPKDIGLYTDVTRRLRQQSSPDVEALIRDDIAMAVALGIDLAGLEGTGTTQPTGVLNQVGVNKPTTFAAANPTFAEVIAMETAVADDNALFGSLAYIGRTNMYGALKTTTKDAGSGQFVVEPDGRVNGYRYIQSNQGTDGNLYFGNWNDLIIGMWGGLDLQFDYTTLNLSGGLRIVAIQTADVAVRHAESFAYNNDTV